MNEISKDLSNALCCDVSLQTVGSLRLIDSKNYCYEDLNYNYSYSPFVYLLNAIFLSIIVPFGGFLPYICLPIIAVSLIDYFNSKKNTKKLMQNNLVDR
jgi:hypothetical protein